MSVDPLNILGGPGAVVVRSDIERRTLSHIETWLIPYLAHIERERGIPTRSLATPKSWGVKVNFTQLPEDALPYVVVISPGTAPRAIERDGDGLVKASWTVAVGCVVSASDTQAAKDLAGYYGAAIRLLMTQMPTLGDYTNQDGEEIAGWADAVEWEDERYDDWAESLERTIAACRQVFTIQVPDVMSVYGGFRSLDGRFVLPGDPYVPVEPYPFVKEVDVAVQARPEEDHD